MKSVHVDQDLKELTHHRTMHLPFACYETQLNNSIRSFIPLHWHEELQFVRLLKGEAVFKISGESVLVREGEGLFINSSCLHSAEEWKQSKCVYVCLNVSPHFMLTPELYTTYVYPYIRATNLPYLRLEAQQFWAENILEAVINIQNFVRQKPSYFEIEITMQLATIWKNLITNGFNLERDQLAIQKDQRMKQMLNWIHQHYMDKVLLEHIANAGQLSRSECCRYFKSILKTTPLKYVTHYRIQKSLSLFKQTDARVTDIAYQVGFNSTSYFIDNFKKAMKMTPLTYKKILESVA